MEFLEVVEARRCIRKFADADVPEEVLKSLIQCALKAPSSMNGQPWCFILVRSPETKRALAELKDRYCPVEKREYPAGFLQEAPVIVITCVERAASFDRGLESGVLATGQLLLAAANYGLTGVYLSAYKSDTPAVADDVRKLIGLPAEYDPVTIVPIGYPGGAAEPKSVTSAEEVMFHESFGRK